MLNAQDYHPFGEVLRSFKPGGARYYDSYIGRWLLVDPLVDKYPGWSPYNYTLNNPLRYDSGWEICIGLYLLEIDQYLLSVSSKL